MPAIIFTAEPTDLITSVGHGLNTGDGAGSVLNIGGTLPGGLSATTDYYWIRIDADHGKLATSVLNAQAGVAVDITSAGSGQHWFGVGLPFRRGVTYAPGALVPSANLNAMQDSIAGQKFKPTPLIITGSAFAVDQGAPTRSGSVWTFRSGSLDVLTCGLVLPPGTRITSLVWSHNQLSNTAGVLNFFLRKRQFGGGAASTNVVSTPSVAGTSWTTVESITSPYVTEAGFGYELAVSNPVAAGAAPQFDGVRVITDRL